MYSFGLPRVKNIYAYGTVALFLLPLLSGIVVFRLFPIAEAIRASLCDVNILSGSSRYVGLENYKWALQDGELHHSLMLTLLFVLIKVPLQIVCSLGLALLAHQKLRMIGFVRSAMFMPVVTSMVIVSIVWAMIYHPNNGLLNGLLALLGLPPQGFLNDSRQALPAVLFTSLWKDVAYTMIIFLAGLQGIPSTFYDAAQVDGASKFKLFWYITLPLLRSTMLFVTVITTINTFQIYTPVYVMTKGGPLQATNVVVYFIYERAFLFNEMGYASALSVTVLLMILAVSLVEMRLMRGHVEY